MYIQSDHKVWTIKFDISETTQSITKQNLTCNSSIWGESILTLTIFGPGPPLRPGGGQVKNIKRNSILMERSCQEKFITVSCSSLWQAVWNVLGGKVENGHFPSAILFRQEVVNLIEIFWHTYWNCTRGAAKQI